MRQEGKKWIKTRKKGKGKINEKKRRQKRRKVGKNLHMRYIVITMEGKT